jgi:hypothetical protein
MESEVMCMRTEGENERRERTRDDGEVLRGTTK